MDIDRIREVIADVAAALTPQQYADLLEELIADAEGYKIQLDELITSGEIDGNWDSDETDECSGATSTE